ncbi:MAG TPA: chromate resistance protein ChrB domain-containing protein [Casimicrobiaceae bacterium]|nr:chromate resistance protein ChrB domain-containing protein [Casimicrobiaceae bacterium]
MDAANPSPISSNELSALSRVFPPPTIVDVRSAEAFARAPQRLPGAIRRDAEADAWFQELEPWRPVAVYCAHGGDRSRAAAAALEARGYAARYLDGGFDAWRAAGAALEETRIPTRWVTRARPKIDRIACPWLVRRFLDPSAEFFYVPTAEVTSFARSRGAEPYDIPDVTYSHSGSACSFDAFIRIHGLKDGALDDLARIVRGADTATLELAPQAPGLLAVSLGLSQMFADDLAMLRWGMLVYDALYAWCRQARGETDGWDPAAIRASAASAA